MATSFEFKGMDELRAALRKLPDDLAHEASVIIHAQAEAVARDIQNAYPEGPTGNLRRGVVVQHQFGNRGGAMSLVRSRARHAHLFEYGSRVRRGRGGWQKGKGSRANGALANRGQMPEAPDSQKMIPKIVRARARMNAALIALVRKAGFEVEER